MSVVTSKPRITIERLRTFVLIGGVLLVLGIAAVLIGGKWVRRYIVKDIPQKLGMNILQQADGVDYSQTRKGRTIFKIHASRAIKRKNDGSAVLQDVRIELYGEDGSRTDTISGKEFEYNPNQGIATAAGEVEIAIMRPGVRPAITRMPAAGSKSNPVEGKRKGVGDGSKSSAGQSNSMSPELRGLSQAISDGQIHVKTSGLVFRQKDGIATTTQRVDFVLRQGTGSATGATYDSQNGSLVLDHDVAIHVEKNAGTAQAPVNVFAAHAEFERDEMTCRLTAAKADYNRERAQSGSALMHFRDDGSVARLDGSNGVDLETDKGSHIMAPDGTLEFDAANHPTTGLLQGGTKFGLSQPDRTIEGTSPTARLKFDHDGDLSQMHLEQGVEFHSRQQSVSGKGTPISVTRSWRSQTADISFAQVQGASKQPAALRRGAPKGSASAHVEPRTVKGYGNVVVTSESTIGGVTAPSHLASDTLTAELTSGSVLSHLSAAGRVSFDERGPKGDYDSGSSDQLEVQFFPPGESTRRAVTGHSTTGSGAGGDLNASEVASVLQMGHVVLNQEPPQQRSGASTGQGAMRATADRSEYDGTSGVVHLSGSPRVRDGSMDLSADRIDLSRSTGDGLAKGHVRISWLSSGAKGSGSPGQSLFSGAGSDASANEPLNAVASEAELHKSAEEVVLRAGTNGSEALHGDVRLWQSVNSVAAPIITLNRQKQTLEAEAAGGTHPVKTVLVGNLTSRANTGAHRPSNGTAPSGTKSSDAPSLIRIRSGSLHYSEGEHLAVFRRGVLPDVLAESTGVDGTSTISAQQADVVLAPHNAASQSGKREEAQGAQHSVDRLVASGNVQVDWPARRGTGEKLVYKGDDGTFTLTGSAATPPRITDEARGAISGSALVYHSGDASVTVEGDGSKTVTDTRSKK